MSKKAPQRSAGAMYRLVGSSRLGSRKFIDVLLV
jgi:hypothetical protein